MHEVCSDTKSEVSYGVTQLLPHIAALSIMLSQALA
jgi:hypothetical protein